MDFNIETIKTELFDFSEKDFLVKYILRSDNWYFSEYQRKSDIESQHQMDLLKQILNQNLGTAFHNVLMVGSGKIGCSLSPHKLFKIFNDDEDTSDIDIAIISSKLFNIMWEQIRKEYSIKYISQYNAITSSIFRGFLNERDFINIDEIRSKWNFDLDFDNVNKILNKELSIYHPINYRIYRSWEDLEDYHLSGIRKIKQQNLQQP